MTTNLHMDIHSKSCSITILCDTTANQQKQTTDTTPCQLPHVRLHVNVPKQLDITSTSLQVFHMTGAQHARWIAIINNIPWCRCCSTCRHATRTCPLIRHISCGHIGVPAQRKYMPAVYYAHFTPVLCLTHLRRWRKSSSTQVP